MDSYGGCGNWGLRLWETTDWSHPNMWLRKRLELRVWSTERRKHQEQFLELNGREDFDTCKLRVLDFISILSIELSKRLHSCSPFMGFIAIEEIYWNMWCLHLDWTSSRPAIQTAHQGAQKPSYPGSGTSLTLPGTQSRGDNMSSRQRGLLSLLTPFGH